MGTIFKHSHFESNSFLNGGNKRTAQINELLNKTSIKNGEQIEATITVTNKGVYDGEEVVQLYIRDIAGSVTRPVKELKGFQKVMIRKGEAKKITFTVTDKELTFLRGDMTWGTEPGMFEVQIGTNSELVKKKSFELVK